jgi:hypothetical protein
METYLTIEEVAEYLKLAVQTIRRWVLNREIPWQNKGYADGVICEVGGETAWESAY